MEQCLSDEDLLAGALAMPAAERGRYVERACAEDSVALERLTALLHSCDDAVNLVAVRFYTERGRSDKLQALTNGTLRADADP
jgi:hypothetical protein